MITSMLELHPMPKKPAPPATEHPDEMPSGTVRIAGDLLEMLRELQFRARDERGKRPTIGQLVEKLLRPAVVKELDAIRKE